MNEAKLFRVVMKLAVSLLGWGSYLEIPVRATCTKNYQNMDVKA